MNHEPNPPNQPGNPDTSPPTCEEPIPPFHTLALSHFLTFALLTTHSERAIILYMQTPVRGIARETGAVGSLTTYLGHPVSDLGAPTADCETKK